MFEDETIDVACPKCGFKNSMLVQELEHTSETHIVCQGCHAGVKIEASEFRHLLDEIDHEVQAMQDEARHATKPKPRKGDFQI